MIDATKGLLLLRLAVDVIAGDRKDAVDVARQLMAIAVSIIPVDELKEFLSEQDRTFADLATDVAEQLKLEGKEP